ncbi:Holliday junction DNA helicase RuvA [Candidatus Collierbacteria bacterium RIFOXYB1_FULL_49_13]|uniref:Holliday junction branch migration complex subunit RuvA n=1 Tax=Candidatus Collierbacteria bacterium RIFOXYB1_FULL_49_13 TaxID=1817728 RepID=A0A1F5FJ24_9BACT|nr:MAG: Holliday junction DNA helicase RuvA [Candidatus Collierbacteria bacterium RIFOXYB1_FULL_49_13]
MIGFLRGRVLMVTTTDVLLDTGGVGYTVFLPKRLLATIAPQSELELFIHTHVSDTAITLYGFPHYPELELFRLLITVSGIGPKTALGVLSTGNPATISAALSHQDVSFFTAIPGIGTKGAQKIIIELKNKFTDQDFDFQSQQLTSQGIDALVNLGFSKDEARAAFISTDSSLTLTERLRLALNQLHHHG